VWLLTVEDNTEILFSSLTDLQGYVENIGLHAYAARYIAAYSPPSKEEKPEVHSWQALVPLSRAKEE
jgi:hypothetical protein